MKKIRLNCFWPLLSQLKRNLLSRSLYLPISLFFVNLLWLNFRLQWGSYQTLLLRFLFGILIFGFYNFISKLNTFYRFLASFYKSMLKRTENTRKMNSFKRYEAPCKSTSTKIFGVFPATTRDCFYCQKPKNFFERRFYLLL